MTDASKSARAVELGKYIVSTQCTVRDAAYAHCVSKSTAHKDLSDRLPQLDKALYAQVAEVLRDNWDERYIRGGEATKQKYTKKEA